MSLISGLLKRMKSRKMILILILVIIIVFAIVLIPDVRNFLVDLADPWS